MMSFPPSYETLKMTLSTSKDEDFTFATISRAMLNEEARRLTSSSMPISEQAALAVYRPQQQQQQQAHAPAIILVPCNWCGLDSHPESNCYREQNSLPQRTPAERLEALRNFRSGKRGGRGGKGTKEAKFADQPGDDNAYLAIASFEDDDDPEPEATAAPVRVRRWSACRADSRRLPLCEGAGIEG